MQTRFWGVGGGDGEWGEERGGSRWEYARNLGYSRVSMGIFSRMFQRMDDCDEVEYREFLPIFQG